MTPNTTNSIQKRISKARHADASAAMQSIPRGLAGEQDPFPVRMNRIMPYADSGITASDGSTATTSGASPYVFQLNSLFAPQGLSNYHQPYGFDTLATLYRRYRVDRVDIELEACIADYPPTPVDAIVLINAPGSSVTTTSTGNAAGVFAEKPNGIVRRQQTGTPSANILILKKTILMHEVCGLTRAEYMANVEEYSALVTATPTRIVQMYVNTSGVAATSVRTAWKSKITFHAEFFERVILAQS